MEKYRQDTITLENVKLDLHNLVRERLDIILEWRLSFIIPCALIAIICLSFGRYFLCLPFALVVAYHTVRFIIELVGNRIEKHLVDKASSREDFSVSVERFNGFTERLIYRPHGRHTTQCITLFVFSSGIEWELFCPRKWQLFLPRKWQLRSPKEGHYPWSELYRINNLKTYAINGDEFYHISIKGRHDIAYIYNTKIFRFEE